jgi:hypothetical protein
VSLTYVIVARIPAEGIEMFQRYESAVLPILPEHGAVLERRLRSADGGTEVHVTRFPSAAAFTAYRDDPRRLAQQELLRASGAEVELHELDDI